jgi:hypothetical protein
MSNECEWLTAGGITIDAAAVLIELKVGDSGPFLHQFVMRKVAAAMAARRGIAVPESETEAALAAFYAERSLFEQEQIDAWHRSVPIEQPALRDFIREQILQRRLGEQLVPDAAVIERFSTNPHEYARAEVNVFTFETEGAADEFILAVRENEVQPFGERVQMFKRDAPPDIAAVLYSAQAGDLVGPVETDDRRYRVYRLLHRARPALDGQLKEILRGAILDELLEAELVRQPREFLL